MNITEKNKVFILETENTQYAFAAADDGTLCHLHWGKKAQAEDFAARFEAFEKGRNGLEELSKTEYVGNSGQIFRPQAIIMNYADRCRETLLKYQDYSITRSDAFQQLDIVLADEPYNVFVTLSYTIYKGYDIIKRSAKIENRSADTVIIQKAASAEINLPSKNPYYSVNPNGSWGAEFILEKTLVNNGTLTYESNKGRSSHTNNPFFILYQNADEDIGDVYYGALVWTGNFKTEIFRDWAGNTKAVIGLSDFDFSHTLHAGESFETPAALIGFSSEGFGSMSNQMNAFSVEHILPKRFANEPLPVLYNSWEATFFDVSDEGQQKLAELAARIGCELFVMDDGWFGQRKDDHAGLGDWYVNKKKFPNGLKPLIDKVNSLGMKFGLWFEPEMVNPDSDLYRAHPDWIYHYDTRDRTQIRNQYILNITKPEVKEFAFEVMDKMLCEYNIEYIKWDMNRVFTEPGAENLENAQELWYRHTMAVYEIADRLKEKHPNLQLECCSSGGGRADLGALSHFDMVWTSDNTDPVDRLEIQHGFSMLYPIKCMRAWVTDTNRYARPYDWDFRFNVSMQGSLSIGGNLLNYSDKELDIHRRYIALYKQIRNTVQFGSFYRLASFGNDGIYATQYVRDSQSVLFLCKGVNTLYKDRYYHIKLKGLEENAKYSIEYSGEKLQLSGAYLMNVGLDLELGGTLDSEIIILTKNS